MPEVFNSFLKTVGGGEGDRCRYPTRLDVYGCGCYHQCAYCVSPDTIITMADSTFKKIKDIEIGDKILGLHKDGNYNKFTEAIVLNKWNTYKQAYRITLSDGRTLISSGDHRWLSNRGWKYTTGAMTGNDRRPYLTVSNYLTGFSKICDEVRINEDYMKGYLRGIILGDGTKGIYSDYRGNSSKQYMFKLIMKGYDVVKRTADYFDYFGITYQWFKMDFRYRDGSIVPQDGIRFNNKESYMRMIELIEPIDSNEFKGGYLAGMYDSEGTSNQIIKRICNTNRDYINEIEQYLSDLGFEYIEESVRTDAETPIWNIRILGGINVFYTFVLKTNPALKDKWSFVDISLKVNKFKDNLKIASIEYIGNMDLIDITTTTENFIANGCISHNCYARSLLDFRKNWHPNNPSVANKDAVLKELDSIEKGTILRLGGMTDPFQPCEDEYHMNRWLIQELNRRGIGYLIVTKGATILEKNMDVLDKDLAHIQISYTHTEGYAPPGFEHASSPSDRIRVAELLNEQGFDVALRLSPYIPQYIDMNLIKNCKVDKILVEFLRANAMIKKKMPYYDFTAWNQKQDGYNQLSLSAKKLLLKPLLETGKKISICEDYLPHYNWFRENINTDKEDCCMLRR